MMQAASLVMVPIEFVERIVERVLRHHSSFFVQSVDGKAIEGKTVQKC